MWSPNFSSQNPAFNQGNNVPSSSSSRNKRKTNRENNHPNSPPKIKDEGEEIRSGLFSDNKSSTIFYDSPSKRRIIPAQGSASIFAPPITAEGPFGFAISAESFNQDNSFIDNVPNHPLKSEHDSSELSTKSTSSNNNYPGSPPRSPKVTIDYTNLVVGSPPRSPGQTKIATEGANKRVILDSSNQKVIKTSFKDSRLSNDKSRKQELKDVFFEYEQGNVLRTALDDEPIKILETTLNKSLQFEQPMVNTKITAEEKRNACKLFLKDVLPNVWRKGVLLFPDVRESNFGRDEKNNTLVLFDWHYDEFQYEEFNFLINQDHLQFLVNTGTIELKDKIEILENLRNALESPEIVTNIQTQLNLAVTFENFSQTFSEGINNIEHTYNETSLKPTKEVSKRSTIFSHISNQDIQDYINRLRDELFHIS